MREEKSWPKNVHIAKKRKLLLIAILARMTFVRIVLKNTGIVSTVAEQGLEGGMCLGMNRENWIICMANQQGRYNRISVGVVNKQDWSYRQNNYENYFI